MYNVVQLLVALTVIVICLKASGLMDELLKLLEDILNGK